MSSVPNIDIIDHKPLLSGLYLVATPIGNLRDITFRALDALSNADIIACEDTRHTARLLSFFGLKKKLYAYHDHSREEDRERIIAMIREGKSVALVSDAGMPLISDPGYKLVQGCYDAGCMVTTLPGANAPLGALQLSGLPSDHFAFMGFFPPKKPDQIRVLEHTRVMAMTVIFFEGAKKVLKTLAVMRDILGDDQPCAVVREMTKMYETVYRGNIADVLSSMQAEGEVKGEIVIILGPSLRDGRQHSDMDVDAMLLSASAQMAPKAAAKDVAQITGLAAGDLYKRLLLLREK